jgi:uncharacterized RDD family membrane protein YckC
VPTSAEWDALASNRDREYKVTRRREVPAETGVASPWRRIAGHLLDAFLSGATFWVGWIATSQTFSFEGRAIAGAVTFAIGWIGWSALAWRRGQSPAKQLLHMYVVHDGLRATWWRMCARELLCKGVAGLLCFGFLRLTYGATLIPYYLWPILDPDHRALWDRFAGTHVRVELD